MKNFLVVTAITSSITLSASATTKPESDLTQEVWGTAKLDNGQVVYVEHHKIVKKDGVVTKATTDYLSPDKTTPIAQLKSDFTQSLQLPIYSFTDFTTKYIEGVRQQNGQLEMYYQEPGKKLKTAPIEKSDRLYAGQGWHYSFLKNLEMIQKKGIAFELLFPGRLDSYPLKVEGSSVKNQQLTAKLSFDHWFLKYFAPEMILTYDLINKRLVYYKGVSNIRDKDGDLQNVEIKYEFPQPRTDSKAPDSDSQKSP